MQLNRPIAEVAISILAAAAIAACGQNALDSAGSGGNLGSGGMASTGGAPLSGGNTGVGGATGAGGTAFVSGSTGGSGAALGGTTGPGGQPASGGQAGARNSGGTSTSNGGSPGTGGKSGSGGIAGASTGAGGVGSGGAAGRASGGGAGASAGAAAGTSGPGSGGLARGGASGAGGGAGVGGAAGTVIGGGGAGGNTGTGGGSSSTSDCSDVSTTTLSFTKRYDGDSIAVTGSTKTYYSATNWWHTFGGQTVGISGLSMKIGNSAGTSVPASDGNPMGFPTIYIGAYSGHETVGSNLPKQVSAIKSVPTIFQTNASTLDTSNLNATYDVWFTASGGKLTSATQNNPGKGGAYLMVWMFKPADRRPRGGIVDSTGDGTPNFTGHTVAGVPGTWDIWIDSTDPLCISYVSSTPIDGLAFDLNNFIQDSVTSKYGITSSMYLNLVFGGFEIWSGGDGLQLKQFCAAVN
jgi:hypothetical protein